MTITIDKFNQKNDRNEKSSQERKYKAVLLSCPHFHLERNHISVTTTMETGVSSENKKLKEKQWSVTVS